MNPQAQTSPVTDLWFCVRRNGAAKAKGWTKGLPLASLPQRVGASAGEVVEVCVLGETRPVPLERFSSLFCAQNRGVLGIGVKSAGAAGRFAPTQMIAANLRFERALEKLCGAQALSLDALAKQGALRALHAVQLLMPVGGAPIQLFRGAPPVAFRPGRDKQTAAELAEGVGQWMLRNLSPAGALPYKYWPSRGQESPADNAIRRFLATWSLARWGEVCGSEEIREAAKRNLRFNMTRYFRVIGEGRGAIVEAKGAKLGAAAIAGLAILESHARGEFQGQLRMLAAGIEHLAHREKGFRTFFFPKERDGDNWNFYSGEALLFWAEAMRRGEAFAPSLERFMVEFRRCRQRHRQARNPAFVPWHTQACASLFAQTGCREFIDFAFEISDWLLPMQQWSGLALDLRGRFYDPERPEFGPPHAASTGAYLEGLADALALARAIGDQPRRKAYGRAIDRGLRSLRQLQFRDWRDAFYIANKGPVLGALRTEVYDNAVRLDSAAHALAAAVKISQPLNAKPAPSSRGQPK